MTSYFNSDTQYVHFFLLYPFQLSLKCKYYNQKFLLNPVPHDYGPIFNTSIWDLPRPRLIQKRRNLLTLLNGDAFYPLSTWPQDIQQLFWKKPIGDTDTFKLMLFFLGNGCSKHLITEWILTSQHWTTLQKGIKRARQINFINNNLDSKANIWSYYQAF